MSKTAVNAGASLNVSRETLERLELFENLVQKWSPKINLVSRSTLLTVWERHILDSVQVFRCTEPKGKWLDIGSGGGFPGLVVAILAQEQAPHLRMTLVESDQRKATFLRTVARETGARCHVLARRIEDVEPQEADILSARALTNLTGLLENCERHLQHGGLALFPKGVTWEKEVEDARLFWAFEAEPVQSVTESGSVILKIKGVSRV